MNRKIILILSVGFILLLAVLTNPGPERHKDAVKSKLKAYMQKAAAEEEKVSDNEFAELSNTIGTMFAGMMIGPMVDQVVSSRNFLVCSTTVLSYDGEVKTIGLGIFGNVFISRKVDKALDNGLMN